MTNENMIKQLERLIPSLKYADDVNAVKGAIKALSQEPRYWIEKIDEQPTIQAVPIDVLDKIIAEIEQERKNCEEVHDHYAGRVLENVLSIIGKYKGGSK